MRRTSLIFAAPPKGVCECSFIGFRNPPHSALVRPYARLRMLYIADVRCRTLLGGAVLTTLHLASIDVQRSVATQCSIELYAASAAGVQQGATVFDPASLPVDIILKYMLSGKRFLGHPAKHCVHIPLHQLRAVAVADMNLLRRFASETIPKHVRHLA